MNIQGIKQAFENFMSDDVQVKEAIMSSTTAGFGGSGYTLELFDDGTFRVLWNGQIGNLHNSRGIMIGIPKLGDDDMADDPMDNYYDNAIEALRESGEYAIGEIVE
jgi:hypothetical protein